MQHFPFQDLRSWKTDRNVGHFRANEVYEKSNPVITILKQFNLFGFLKINYVTAVYLTITLCCII